MLGFSILLLFAPALLPGASHLSGVVRDGSGAVIRDATVTAVNAIDGTRRSARSGKAGDYLLSPLSPGRYKVIARKPGFQTAARLDLDLADGDNLTLDFPMTIGSVREVITILSPSDPINSNNATTGAVIEKDYFDLLPANGRTFTSLLELVPALVVTPAAGGEPGQFSVAGQRPNTNYFSLDGLSANASVTGGGLPAQFGGGALPALTAFGSTHNLSSLDAVAEVRVETSTFAPEHGRMPGAHIALLTRSGTNALHGSLSHVFRHEALNATDWYANANGLERPQHRLQETAASLGGPLRRDRTFFFADFLRLRLQQPYVWDAVVPSMASRAQATGDARTVLNAFPQPNGADLANGLARFSTAASRPADVYNGSLRVDHSLNAKLTLFGRYNQAPSSVERGLVSREYSEFAYRSLTVGATGVPGPTLSYDLRLNVSNARATGLWVTDTPLPATSSGFLGIAVQGAGEILAGQGSANRQGQLSGSAALDWFKDKHRIRLGAEYQRLTPSRDRRFVSTASDYGTIADLLANRPPVNRDIVADQGSSMLETLSLFVQDAWRINDRTSLTYGLRWEITPAPSLRGGASILPGPPNSIPPSSGGTTTFPGIPTSPGISSPFGPPTLSLWPTSYGQVAPRIGLAHRLAGNTTLRAGWGIFYNLGFSAAADPINGFPFNRWQFRAGEVSVTTSPYLPGGASGDTGLRLPLAHHWNVAIEHMLAGNNLISASYIGSAGRRLLRREGFLQQDGKPSETFTATSHGESSYHGLALQLRRPLSRRVQLTAAYTWAHAIDNGSWDSNVWLLDPAGADGRRRERASASFDTRHSFTGAFTWQAFRGWQLSGLLRARSGFPIDVLSKYEPLGFGYDNAGRPSLVAGVPVWLADPQAPGGRRLNPAAFLPENGLQGTLGRNALRGFGMFQTDMGLARPFRVRAATAEFRLDAFNLLNRASFADPVRYLNSPLFGRSMASQAMMLGSGSARSGLSPVFQNGGARTLQVTLRLRF